MNRKVISDPVTKVIYEFSAKEIIEALVAVGQIPANAHNLESFVQVPGGGDWSNMELEVDDEHPLKIRAEEW